MKKTIILLITLINIILPANAEIVKISADDAVHLALKNNLALQAKRKEIDILKQEIKIANALKNGFNCTNKLQSSRNCTSC